MSKESLIQTGEWPGFERKTISAPAGPISVRVGGDAGAPAVLFNHSILTGSAIWHRQAQLLADEGRRVICLDSRGHGKSAASPSPYTMDDLVRDNLAVLDELGVARVHFIGVSQGGMTGLGLGIGLGVGHAGRLASLMVCAARADAPAPFAAAWDDRIALARDKGVEALAAITAERWFGADFIASNPGIAADIVACIRETSVEGFVGCARAIQGLDYLGGVANITTPTALVIGTRDEALLQPMRDLAKIIPGAKLSEIEDAGHLPQIDQPDRFNAVLREHFARVG